MLPSRYCSKLPSGDDIVAWAWNHFELVLMLRMLAAKELPLAPKSPTALIQLSADSFTTEREYLYFNHFRDKIAADISPYFNGDAWGRMILQACAEEPAIRHAAIAIGALGKMFEATKDGEYQVHTAAGCFDAVSFPKNRIKSQELGNCPSVLENIQRKVQHITQEARSHHQHALEQYDTAIKQMRANALRGEQALRVTLISCIVIVCFETLHGNNESAAQQLQMGTRLLQDWKLQQRNSDKHALGYSSPAPDVVDDVLCQAIGRMEIQTMSFYDNRSPDAHRRLKTEGEEVIERMPEQFTSLNDARIYFELIRRRVMHFTASAPFKVYPESELASDRNVEALETQLWAGWGKSWKGKIRQPLPVTNQQFIHQYNCTQPETMFPISGQPENAMQYSNAHSECQGLIGELRAWVRSFRPLLETSIQKRSIDAISALTLNIQQQTCSLFRAVFFTTEMEWDIFIPEFRTIVSQASRLLALQEELARKKSSCGYPALAFSFDAGYVLSLYIVAMKCREGKTRRAALRLLRRHPRREGIWDSVVVSAGSAWIMGLEGQLEEGADEVVPEERRARKLSMDFDLICRTAKMTCLQMDGETGRLTGRTQVYTW